MRKIAIFLMLMLVSAAAFANPERDQEPYVGSAAFEQMKTLKGNWEGVFIENGGIESPAKVSYEVSSGGSALIEKLGPGSPSEMVSIYNDENSKLVMTHYCMMKNQPKLSLVSFDVDHVSLEMAEAANGVKLTDDHMHALKITFKGKDEIVQEWRGFKDGKLAETPVIINLKRAS